VTRKKEKVRFKDYVVEIDGESLGITPDQYDFLDWMSNECIFRKLSDYVFISQDRERHNPLSAIFEQPLSDDRGLTTRVDNGSQVITQSFDEWLEAVCRSSDDLRFIRLILISLLKLNPNFKTLSPRTSEARESEAMGKAASQEKKLVLELHDPTEGSKEFNELDRNELPPLEKPVKRKRKSSKVTTRYISDDCAGEKDGAILLLASEWIAWNIQKWPWVEKRLKIEKVYDTLCTIRNTTDLSISGLRAVFDFIRNDDFWKDQVVNPTSLLTSSKNGLRKIDNVLIKFKKECERNRIFSDSEWKDPF
jgi:hypothetical protein